jgi:protein tyrosine/serine phosphatase
VDGLLIIIGQITMDHPSTSFIRLQSKLLNGFKVRTKNKFLKFMTLNLADPANIIVVHCNSGKGRTGTAICAILLYMGYCDSIDDCLRFYGY